MVEGMQGGRLAFNGDYQIVALIIGGFFGRRGILFFAAVGRRAGAAGKADGSDNACQDQADKTVELLFHFCHLIKSFRVKQQDQTFAPEMSFYEGHEKQQKEPSSVIG